MLKIGKKFLPGFVSLVLKAYLSDENHKSVVLLHGKMPLFFFFLMLTMKTSNWKKKKSKFLLLFHVFSCHLVKFGTKYWGEN